MGNQVVGLTKHVNYFQNNNSTITLYIYSIHYKESATDLKYTLQHDFIFLFEVRFLNSPKINDHEVEETFGRFV